MLLLLRGCCRGLSRWPNQRVEIGKEAKEVLSLWPVAFQGKSVGCRDEDGREGVFDGTEEGDKRT